MKPLALDLCCGKGGWTKGLIAARWDVIGVDIEQWEGYPKEADFWKDDIREISITKEILNNRKVLLIVASPPCQEFSYRSFPFKRCRELAATVPPDKSIWEACERIAKECNAPLILENVRGAQKYMGKAKAHFGSFYLWGDIPLLLPIGRPIKGFTRSSASGFKCDPINGKQWRGNSPVKAAFPGENEREHPVKDFRWNRDAVMNKRIGGALTRKEWSANAAMIPFELARWIGECFYPS